MMSSCCECAHSSKYTLRMCRHVFFFFLNLCPSDVYSNSFLQGCHPKTEEGTFRERIHGVLITGVSVGLVSHFPKRENMFFLSICEKIPSC